MSDLSPTMPAEARKERRRLHLREVAGETAVPRQSVGELLRTARLDRGEDANAVAALLKMRREQLDAIEEGNLAALPAKTYAVGFVRAYARHLGVDAEALVQQFKEETAGLDLDKPTELVFPKAREEYRPQRSSMLVLALALAMGIYGISYLTIPGRQAAQLAQAQEAPVVVEPAKAPPAKPVNVPTESQRAPVEVAVGFTAGKPALPEQHEPIPTALTPAPSAEPFSIAQADPAPASEAQPQAAVQPAPPADPAQPAARIVLKAIEPTYIQVRDPKLPRSRSILIARVLNVGESYASPDRSGLIMQTGNAGGLQVEVDGRSLGVMGRSGEVITRVPLDPSYFLERMATTQ